MLSEKIKEKLAVSFLKADIKIFTSDDKHFNIVILSDDFKDKSLVERQKLIYDVIGEYITTGELHAVSLKTYTYDELSKDI